MSTNRPRVLVNPNSSQGLSVDVQDNIHSVSPAWVLTFLRWENRHLSDSGATSQNSEQYLSVRPPLVVDSDCFSLSISNSKSSHTPSLNAMLYASDVNYLAAVAPGDYVTVNILNTPDEARRIAKSAEKGEAINKYRDGFKGVFKVSSVRKVLSNDPNTGIKRVAFQISAFAFTELNNTLYFNPLLLGPTQDNEFLFVTRISKVWEDFFSKKGIPTVQEIMQTLIIATIGAGFNEDATTLKAGLNLTPNTHFYIPKQLGNLLGVSEARAAKDINRYLFGIQRYQGASTNLQADQTYLPTFLNPVLEKQVATSIADFERLQAKKSFLFCETQCQGFSSVKPEYWNQVTVWSLLNQYVNSPINELFTCFRIDPSGSIMPTVVFRQIPFSTDKFKGISTKFSNLPAWVISPDLMVEFNMGREDAARINFVQAYTAYADAKSEANQSFMSTQISLPNWKADSADIVRSGLKPYIFTSNFDSLASDKQSLNAKNWSELLADAVFGGQLKLNGSLTTYGIVEPIAVGDNLELDGVLFHIESISHNCSQSPDGIKSWTTSFELSHGVDLNLSGANPDEKFAQMATVSVDSELQRDEVLLPGIATEKTPDSVKLGGNNSSLDPFSATPKTPKDRR